MMKRIVAVLLLLTVLAGLCACGRGDKPADETAQPTETAQTAAASNSDADAVDVPPASGTDTTAVNTAAYETAQQYIGRTVGELYAAIGEPTDSQYAASCEEENAEDGMLFYDEGGFYIWSVRTATDETVRAVYLNQ